MRDASRSPTAAAADATASRRSKRGHRQLESPLFAARQIEQRLDELDEALGVGRGDLEAASLARVDRAERAAQEQIVVALDAYQRRAQLVRHVGQKLRLEPIERRAILIALANLLELLERRVVARHAFEDDHAPRRVAHGIERELEDDALAALGRDRGSKVRAEISCSRENDASHDGRCSGRMMRENRPLS